MSQFFNFFFCDQDDQTDCRLSFHHLSQRITVSGCNIWKKQVIACAKKHFAFASTLAIHVYSLRNFQLVKLLNQADTNITAIEWQPVHEKYLAQATYIKQFAIWDVEKESIKFQLNLQSHVHQIEWSRQNLDEIHLLLANYELKRLHLSSQKVTDVVISYKAGSFPKVVRVHPRDNDVVVVGLSKGNLLFFNQQTGKTLSLRGMAVEEDEESKEAEKENRGVTDLSWDPYENNLLAAFEHGAVCLISFQGLSQKTTITQVFVTQTESVSNLFWVDDKSGNFVTANTKVGTLCLWNAANRDVQKVLKVGSSGVHYMQPIAGNHQKVVIGLKNGAITLFNLDEQKSEFSTESGHSETIFDIDYHPTETNLLASCSYDGTVRIWDSATSKLVSINDATRNSPISHAEKKIIYSCSWHPTLTKIAMSTISGHLLIYDALKGKLLSSLVAREGHSCFKTQWNKRDPRHILLTSADNAAFVIGVMDQPKCIQLTVQNLYILQSPVYGGAWSPHDPSMFAVGCKDGKVRVFELSLLGPIKTLEGHIERVYNVVFHPTMPHLLASGSDDRTIKIWDLNQQTCVQTLGGTSPSSHVMNVRALQFAPEIVWCVLSGSWDGTIKVWDIRSGQCLLTLTDHNSDVYGITFQSGRPFVFASCSRDTTIRHWCIDGLLQQLKLKLLHGQQNQNEVYGSPEECYKLRGKYKLCSNYANQMTETKSNKDDILRQLKTFDYLFQHEGQDELLAILKHIMGAPVDNLLQESLSEPKLMHADQLIPAYLSRASNLSTANGMKLLNTQFSRKEDRLTEIANTYLNCGKIREFCEVQCELGNFTKAMAFAPAVSIEYWQELADRRATMAVANKTEDAASCAIVANQVDMATEIVSSQGDYETAKLIRSHQLRGIFADSKVKSSKKWQSEERKFTVGDQTLNSLVSAECEETIQQRKCCKAAAIYLSVNDYKNSLETLVRGNELYLAMIVARFCDDSVAEVALLLAERAEKYFCTEIALELVQRYAPEQIELTKRRLINSGLIKDVEGMETNYSNEAQGALKSEPSVNSLKLLILANKLHEACSQADALMSSLYKKPSPQFFEVADLIQCVSLHKLPKEVKTKTLHFCTVASVFKAIHYGLFNILLQLQLYAERLENQGPVFEFIDAIVNAYVDKAESIYPEDQPPTTPLTSIPLSLGPHQSKFDSFKSALASHHQGKLFSSPGFYSFATPTMHLKGDSVSAFSETVIKGQSFQFEDGKTRVSQEEACEWALCCRFSVLGNGYRVNPW